MFNFPDPERNYRPLSEILQPDEKIDDEYLASDRIRKKRKDTYEPDATPSVWHENKPENISSYPYSY